MTDEHQQPAPNPALERLDVMAGTWDLKGRVFESGGDISGKVTLEWLAGGYFMVQRVDVDHAGERVTGAEYIGYDADKDSLKSYFFSNQGPGPFGGVALEYVWEVDDDNLTIWGGEVGSPAAFKGTFSDGHDVVTGRWEWPGGGYDATMTRVK